jgi:hypothetical protein
VVKAFLDIREETWPTIARNQRQIAGLSKEVRERTGVHRLGLGLGLGILT